MHRSGLIAVLLLALAACGPSRPRGEPLDEAEAEPSAVPSRETLLLTAGRPRATIDPGPLPEGRAVLELELLSIEGADDAFVVRIAFAPETDGAESFEIGRVTPFPPDRAARFALPIPDALARSLRASPGLRISIEVLPIAADRPLPEDLILELAPLRWRREP